MQPIFFMHLSISPFCFLFITFVTYIEHIYSYFFCFYVLFLILVSMWLLNYWLFLQKPVNLMRIKTLMRIARIYLVGMGLTSFSASELSLLTFLGSVDARIVPGSHCSVPIRGGVLLAPVQPSPVPDNWDFILVFLLYFQVY